MKFGVFLREVILEQSSRAELMTKLQLKYRTFSGLDSITLSRWVAGSTTPSIYKQLLISDCVGKLDEYLKSRDLPKVPTAAKRAYQAYVKQFEHHYYHKILSPYDIKQYVRFFRGPNVEARKYYASALKMKGLSDSKQHVDKKGHVFPVDVFYTQTNNHDVISYAYFNQSVNAVFDSINVNLIDEVDDFLLGIDLSNCICIGLNYFYDIDSHDVLAGLLLNRLIRHHFNKEYLFCVIRGKESMDFWESMGGKKIASVAEQKGFGNVHLYAIDIKRFFGKAVVMDIIVRYYEIYETLFEDVFYSENKEVLLQSIKQENRF